MQKNSKWNSKRIVAIVGLALLALLYIVFFVASLFAKSVFNDYYMLIVIATIFIPILIWVYIWLYGVITGKHTMASFDIGETGQPAVKSDSSTDSPE